MRFFHTFIKPALSRALTHCCGGKPGESLGQEEVLNMLSRRFEADEPIRFEQAVRNVERISENAAALRNLPTD